MKYFELKCMAFIKQEIEFSKSFETISKYISYSMAQSELLDSHNTNNFKHYVFGGFRKQNEPLTKVYQSGETYEFSIHSLDETFVDKLSLSLRQNINNSNFLVLQTLKRVVKKSFITELYSATPVIVSIENKKFWTMESSGDIIQLQKQLHDNLEKKYQSFYGEEIKATQNFIQLLEIKNRVPQTIVMEKNGKKIRFFGNKFKIVPNEDEISQKLAFVAMACGLGEKNSYGGGFLLSHSLSTVNRSVGRG
ncbi:MAG: CRISPR-associated endoribonuclease Cas6 [Arcobacteraceae bacterium]|jgi:CRISPR-associated endoribonuclease Cas6|nr:CRISPR-associated endoribonuclease Cas6 [Arcobacteraceae bacterium]